MILQDETVRPMLTGNLDIGTWYYRKIPGKNGKLKENTNVNFNALLSPTSYGILYSLS